MDINFLDQAADVPVSMWPAEAAEALAPLCCACRKAPGVYENYARQPFCSECADGQPVADAPVPIPVRPVDWSGHVPIGPVASFGMAVESLRQHADRLEAIPAELGDATGRAAAAAELRTAALFLEGQGLPPLPRRPRSTGRLRRGFVQALLDNAATQGRPVDVQFVVPPHPDGPPGP